MGPVREAMRGIWWVLVVVGLLLLLAGCAARAEPTMVGVVPKEDIGQYRAKSRAEAVEMCGRYGRMAAEVTAFFMQKKQVMKEDIVEVKALMEKRYPGDPNVMNIIVFVLEPPHLMPDAAQKEVVRQCMGQVWPGTVV